MIYIQKNLRYLTAFGGLILLSLDVSANKEIAPPRYNLVDWHGVNMATGAPQVSINDVSIGGAMGLTHNINNSSSSFVDWYVNSWGYGDNFRGGLYNTLLVDKDGINNDVWVLRSTYLGNTVDFTPNGDGTYTAMSDLRYQLIFVQGEGYVLLGKEGERVVYKSSGSVGILDAFRTLRSPISSVEMSNGMKFTIEQSELYDYPESVRTNTGYQLRYLKEDDYREIEPEKAAATNDPNMPSDSFAWSSTMPKRVVALNNTVDVCQTNTRECDFSQEWPTATYNWPAGMPRAFHVGTSVFSVTDMNGGVTEFHHTAYDRHVPGEGATGDYLEPGEKFVPRLTGIKPAYSDEIEFSYSYENNPDIGSNCGGLGFCVPRIMSSQDAILVRATRNGVSNGYSFGNPKAIYGALVSTINGAGRGYKYVSHFEISAGFATAVLIETWDRGIKLDWDFEGKVRSVYYKKKGGKHEYFYDDRGNVVRTIFTGKSSQDTIVLESKYADNCTIDNYKYCNKPEWTRDAKGSQTDYQYHLASGLVSSIKLPPNENGVRPTTVFSYAKYYATYKINGNSAEQSPDGIWLLEREISCSESSLDTDTKTCANNDAIVKTYEYEPGNLQLVGVAVHAGNKTLKTCTQYDVYGNVIGTLKPKSNVASCL